MKRVVAESYNYKRYVIESTPQGWCVYEYPTFQVVAGPFNSWYDAQVYVDENLND